MLLPTDLSTITSHLSHFIIYPSLPFFIPRHNERKRFCNRLKVSPLVPVYLPPFLPGRGQWRYNGDITPMNRDIIQWRAQTRPSAALGWLFIIVLASAGHFLSQKSELGAASECRADNSSTALTSEPTPAPPSLSSLRQIKHFTPK